MTDINKPFSLEMDEFKKNLVILINNTNLHISVKDMVVANIYMELHQKAEYQVAREKMEYEAKLNETNDASNEESTNQ